MEDIINAIIKALRLSWQREANVAINAAEELAVEKAKQWNKEKATGIPDEVIDAVARKVYWFGWNYVKEQLDADWIQDT